MDFSLTREQEMIKQLAAQFVEEVLEPVAADVYLSHTFHVDNFRKMAKLGFQVLDLGQSCTLASMPL